MKLDSALALLACAGATTVALTAPAQTPASAPSTVPAPAPSAAGAAASTAPAAPAAPAEPTAPTTPSEPAAPGASVTSPTWTAPPPPAEKKPDPGKTATPSTKSTETTPEQSRNQPTTPGWFRFDSDVNGVSLWVGATHDLGGVGLATDVMVSSGSYADIASGRTVPFSLAEFDIGPAFMFADGALRLTPMAGLQFDWVERRTVSLPAPQLFTIVDAGPVYFESWVQTYFYGIFTEGAEIKDNLYTRDFLLYELADVFALGPNFELTYLFQSKKIFSMPIGGAAMLSYGAHSTLLLALGYETRSLARATSGGSEDRALAGRFTFIQTW